MVRRSKSGSIIGWGAGDGQGIPLQRKQGGEETLLGTTDSSVGQIHRTTFGASRHTHSSHDTAVYLDNGLSFDASLELRRGKDLALAVGGSRVRKGKSVGIISWGAGDEEGILLQRKQNGG